MFSWENKDAKHIYLRPEPWTAQYYKGKQFFLDELLLELQDDYTIIILPRGEEQKAYYRQKRFSRINVPEASIDLNAIIDDCDLFIGAGGTMTREAAVLGVPTISIYQDELLDVDRYLIENGFMLYDPELKSEAVKKILSEKRTAAPNKEILERGRKAYELIKLNVLNYRQGDF